MSLNAVERSSTYERLLVEFAKESESYYDVRLNGSRHFSWRIFVAKEELARPQGWKIHVSASACEASTMLASVLPLVREHRCSFKVPQNLRCVVAINSGEVGEWQSGKVLTVYPNSDEQARQLVTQLAHAWPSSCGPIVSTDRLIENANAISLRYGVFWGGNQLIDEDGFYKSALITPEGTLEIDRREFGYFGPIWAPPPPHEKLVSVAQHSATLVEVEDRCFLKVALLQPSPSGRVYLGVCNQTLETVVIKTCRQGMGQDLNGIDKRQRLTNEKRVLDALANTSMSTRVIRPKQEIENALVVEFVDGLALSSLPQQDQINILPLFAHQVQLLHDEGFVHRDLKLSNAILSKNSNSVFLIDFELSAAIGTESPISGGTLGYIPPESMEANSHQSYDCFALGICICHAYMGIDPATKPIGAGRLIGILQALGEFEVSSLVKQLISVDHTKRPAARIVSECLKRISAENTSKRSIVAKNSQPRWAAKWCRKVKIDAGLHALTYGVSSPLGIHWRNEHIHQSHFCEAINIGSAGIILGLLSLGACMEPSDFSGFIGRSCDALCESKLISQSPGLFTGDAGVALALAAAGRLFGESKWTSHCRHRLEVLNTPKNDDLFSGKAGVVWSAVLISRIIDQEWPLHLVADLVERIRICQFEEPASHDQEQYLGAAHGLAGISLALAAWGKAVGREEVVSIAKENFRKIITHSQMLGSDSTPRLNSQIPTFAPIGHWCHGLAGVVWCMLQAFPDGLDCLSEELSWAIVAYLKSPLLADNATYCHGLAGELELCRMLMRLPRFYFESLSRAWRIIGVLRFLTVRENGRRVWSSESPQVVTPDLWVGFLGPATAISLFEKDVRCALISDEWLQQCTKR